MLIIYFSLAEFEMSQNDPLILEDLFTLEQRRNGAIGFHIFGVFYMIFALTILCNQYFVKSILLIIQKLQISNDVAG